MKRCVITTCVILTVTAAAGIAMLAMGFTERAVSDVFFAVMMAAVWILCLAVAFRDPPE